MKEKKQSKKITFLPLEGEIGELCSFVKWLPGTLEVFPPEEKNEPQYEVYGEVYCLETSTRFKFEKTFEQRPQAEAYFAKMQEKYPVSEIILKEINTKEIQLFA